jgi:hypothetical protein
MSSPAEEGENKAEGSNEAITIRVRDQVSTSSDGMPTHSCMEFVGVVVIIVKSVLFHFMFHSLEVALLKLHGSGQSMIPPKPLQSFN